MKHHMMITPFPYEILQYKARDIIHWQCSRCGITISLTREAYYEWKLLSDFKWTMCDEPYGEGSRDIYDRILRKRYGG